MSDKRKQIVKSILKLLLGLIVIGLFVSAFLLILYYGFNISISDLRNRDKMQEFVKSYSSYSILIFILISFLQVTFVPIPSTVTILAGNYLFGMWKSFLYSYIGMIIGSIVAFLLGRLVGRPFVNWVVGSKEKVDMYLEKLKGKGNVLLFFMFLLPLFPDDILCSVAGITSMSWFTFIVMQLITRFTSIGATLLFMSGEFIPYSGWGIPVLIILGIIIVILFIISFKYANQINNFLGNISLKITSFFKSKKNKDK